MKIVLFILMCTFSASILIAQEIQFNSPLVATAGSNESIESVNISKWRIGEVHLIVLQQDNLTLAEENDWKVTTYPNPFSTLINLAFDLKDKGEFFIQVTDISGKKQLVNTKRMVFPKEVLELDLSNLASGMYLLTVMPENQQAKRVMKIQKN